MSDFEAKMKLDAMCKYIKAHPEVLEDPNKNKFKSSGLSKTSTQKKRLLQKQNFLRRGYYL